MKLLCLRLYLTNSPHFCFPFPCRLTTEILLFPVNRRQEDGRLPPCLLYYQDICCLIRNDLVIASNAAYTLAWLDQALATLADLSLPEGSQPPPIFGQLAHW